MSKPILRSPTGVEALDRVLEGGFPRGSLVLVAGHPGAGKTIFAATYLYNGAVKYGEKGVYVSFAEDRDSFFTYMKRLGMDFKSIEDRGLFEFISIPHADVEANVESIIARIMRAVREEGVKRVVIDSVSAILQSIQSPSAIRGFLRSSLIYGIRSLSDTTVIIIADLPYGTDVIGFGVEEFVVDGVLVLKSEYGGGTYFRWIEIRKMRGTNLESTLVPYTIDEKGFSPILFPTESNSVVCDYTGEKGLEPITKNMRKIFGKIPLCSIILVTGVHGAGKSLFAIELALNALAHGKKVLYISYNEPEASLMEKTKYVLRQESMAWDDVNWDNMEMLFINPFAGEISSALRRIRDLILSRDPDVIVFDGVEVFSGIIPTRINRFMNRNLATYIRSRGKLLLQTLLIHPRMLFETSDRSFLELGAVSDIIVSLEHDTENPRYRIVTVTKSRGEYVRQLRERLVL